jgi:cysteine desulfuration protein SufE
MATIQEKQQALIQEFEFFDEWMDKYNYIIEMGKSLPTLPEDKKNDDLLVPGCQSKVWLHVEKRDNKIVLSADADAIIAKGIVAMLIEVFSDQPAKEVAGAQMKFIEDIGLKDHLSPTRANGLISMVKQIKYYALAFSA